MQMYVNAVVCLCDDFFFNELLKFKVKFVVFVWRDKKQTNKQPNWEPLFLDLGAFLAYYASTYTVV